MRTKQVWICLLLSLLLPTVAPAENGQREKESKKGAKIALQYSEHDFGTVDRRGGDLKVVIPFRNEGDAPLVLTRVITSCSCLKSHFSKRPVAIGEAGEITLTYEPLKADPGTFNKVVQILSNSTDGREIIMIRGNSVDSKWINNEK